MGDMTGNSASAKADWWWGWFCGWVQATLVFGVLGLLAFGVFR